MASLPSVPFTDIDDVRTAVDSPVSNDLWEDAVINLNYLKAVLSDGAAAPQDINAANAVFNDDVDVVGTLTVGSFVVPETALIFAGIDTET